MFDFNPLNYKLKALDFLRLSEGHISFMRKFLPGTNYLIKSFLNILTSEKSCVEQDLLYLFYIYFIFDHERF